MANDNNELPTPMEVQPVPVQGSVEGPPLRVGLERVRVPPTLDQSLWASIRYATNQIGFQRYADFLEPIMCGHKTVQKVEERRNSLPFPGVDAYALLKASTEVFLMANCGVDATGGTAADNERWAAIEGSAEEAIRVGDAQRAAELRQDWDEYRIPVDASGNKTVPYLDIIRRKLGLPVVEDSRLGLANDCYGVLQRKMVNPCMIELIWSYWLEEGMLVQTMNAITQRFQNRRGTQQRDPLVALELDPLRPLNAFLWGFVQDEQHRLTVQRRAHEYEHEYGFTIQGKAVAVRAADRRSKFLEAFHNLLYLCTRFYVDDDDTTRVADGFAVLNALKEVHLLLTEGGHNQYGDLPWTARMEMMMAQWILARQEMREFLQGRVMVAYPEPWMDRVDTMKTLQGWTDTNISHFRYLSVFGEQIMLAVRFGAWSTVILPQQAANWARYWRPEIQGYIHSYRAATGVDLTAMLTDSRSAADRYIAPSALLASRLADQNRGK